MDHLSSRTGCTAAIDHEIARLAAQVELADTPALRADLYDEMALQAVPLADSIARRYFNHGIDHDDLVQVARLAVVKAVRRYRLGAGTGFTAYAVPTISGEVKRFFRDHGWSVRPPRRVQELRMRVQSEEERLRHLMLRHPTDSEIAAVVRCTPHEVVEARASSGAFHATSLDAPTPAGDTLGDQMSGAASPAEDIIVRDALRRGVASLDERQRLVVRLRFADDLTQCEIAARIGVSQMQVSRMLSRIIDTLRCALDDRRLEPA